MIFTAENILLIGSILLFISIIVGKTGYRFGVPALLLFLVVGMIFGVPVMSIIYTVIREKTMGDTPEPPGKPAEKKRLRFSGSLRKLREKMQREKKS